MSGVGVLAHKETPGGSRGRLGGAGGRIGVSRGAATPPAQYSTVLAPSDLVAHLLEDDKVQRLFCENCPAVSVLRGSRDCWGHKVEPDEDTCPADFDPGSPRCERRDDHRFLRELFEEVESTCRGE